MATVTIRPHRTALTQHRQHRQYRPGISPLGQFGLQWGSPRAMLTVLTQEVSSSGNNWEAKPSDLVVVVQGNICSFRSWAISKAWFIAEQYFICCN
jgi:hypothetical protein